MKPQNPQEALAQGTPNERAVPVEGDPTLAAHVGRKSRECQRPYGPPNHGAEHVAQLFFTQNPIRHDKQKVVEDVVMSQSDAAMFGGVPWGFGGRQNRRGR